MVRLPITPILSRNRTSFRRPPSPIEIDAFPPTPTLLAATKSFPSEAVTEKLPPTRMANSAGLSDLLAMAAGSSSACWRLATLPSSTVSCPEPVETVKFLATVIPPPLAGAAAVMTTVALCLSVPVPVTDRDPPMLMDLLAVIVRVSDPVPMRKFASRATVTALLTVSVSVSSPRPISALMLRTCSDAGRSRPAASSRSESAT